MWVCPSSPSLAPSPDGELPVTSGANAESFLLLQCSPLPAVGLGSCKVTDATVRGQADLCPPHHPGHQTEGRSLTPGLGGGLGECPSLELQLPTLLSKEAMSVLETELCHCLGLLGARAVSAQEAAAGVGAVWSCFPALCSGRGFCSQRFPCPPSLTCCGYPVSSRGAV